MTTTVLRVQPKFARSIAAGTKRQQIIKLSDRAVLDNAQVSLQTVRYREGGRRRSVIRLYSGPCRAVHGLWIDEGGMYCPALGGAMPWGSPAADAFAVAEGFGTSAELRAWLEHDCPHNRYFMLVLW